MVFAIETPAPSKNPLASRVLSVLELFFGVFIVIGHNVFHIVPNEVLVLSVLGLTSIRLRDGNWSAMGFKRPKSRRRIFLIALAAAAFRIVLGQFVIEPITGIFWPRPSAPALANEITANAKVALLAFLIVWTFVAFGEEIAYRDISLRVQPTLVRDPQPPIGLRSSSSRFCLATGIITKGPRESLIPELQDSF